MSDRSFILSALRGLRAWLRGASPQGFKTPLPLDENGSSVVEFTAMAPLLFLIVYGIIEWGSIFYLQNNMVNAAREAARGAAMTQTNTQAAANLIPAAANQNACNWLARSGQTLTITTTDLCSKGSPECPTGVGTCPDYKTQITVDADKASIFNYLGLFTGVKFGGQTTFRREQPCPTTPVAASTCTCNATVNPPTGC